MVEINFKKVTETAKEPHRGSAESAGYDLYVDFIEFTHVDGIRVIKCHTGIAVDIPKGFCGLLMPRSSVASKGVCLANSVGLIDSDYTGELIAQFVPNTEYCKGYKQGERCCQLVIVPYLGVSYKEVNELKVTERGDKGFGSTGK